MIRTHDLALRVGLLVGSGAIALVYEVLWMRRLTLWLGGGSVASAVAVSAFLAGLVLGARLADRLGGALRTYAALEALAALWALGFPGFEALLRAGLADLPGGRWVGAALLVLPPATCLGATWPVALRGTSASGATTLYAANTAGAVLGVLGVTFVALPWLGVRGSEVLAAAVGLALAGSAAALSRNTPWSPAPAGGHLPADLALAAAAGGFTALGLEVVWMRLAAVAFGGTVHTFGRVLAVFLVAVAFGAWLGGRPSDPKRLVGPALGAAAALALLGGLSFGALPVLSAQGFVYGGELGAAVAATIGAALAMGGAPIATGAAFALGVRSLGSDVDGSAARFVAANTLGSLVGSLTGSLVLLPALGMNGAVATLALVSAAAGSVVSRRPIVALPAVILVFLVPSWDARLYAVGVHLRVSDFADPSPAALRVFADEGWELLSYEHGRHAAVAVGRSTTTGNVWLSLDGKVDASTGGDMPTQVLSGTLPVRLAAHPDRVLVVGLASGVTAGAVLAERVREVVVVELEPAVVRASRYFDAVSGAPLDDPRTTLIVDDARAVLDRGGPRFDVITSEPSNPWLSGPSALFTLDYWQLVRGRLAPDGVFAQWLQLYGMGPDHLRALVRTFLDVFPHAYLYETIEDTDVLLVGGAVDPRRLEGFEPLLGPRGLRCLGGSAGWRNTDDRPRVEWEAASWLHRATASSNAAAIEAAGRECPE